MNRRQLFRDFTTINRRYETKYLPKVKAALMPYGLIETVRVGGASAGKAHLHQTIHNPKLNSIIKTLYVDVGLRHAQINYSRMRKETRGQKYIAGYVDVNNLNAPEVKFVVPREEKASFGFNDEWTSYILNYLQRFLLEQITFEVATSTRDEMLKVLEQAIREGWGIDQTVKALEELPFTTSQAARIVRTEINRAANVGAKAQSETFQYEQMKEWISANDDRVRGFDPKDHASHIALDGVRINEGDVFRDPRNGDLLEFPGDPRASAASTINCRCQVAYVAKRDQDGRLIPKRQSTSVIFPNQNRQRQTVLI